MKICISLKKKKGRIFKTLPTHFQTVKLSLDGLLPSRAYLRFTLQNKGKYSLINKKNVLLTEVHKNGI
jgi:hypothetical protein